MLLDIVTQPFLLIFAALLTFLYLRTRKSKYNLPPGPRGWPFIGNILEVRASSFIKDLENLRQKYGDIFTVWFGACPIVVINGYDIMREAFLKRGDEFSDRPNNFVSNEICKQSGIICSSGNVWKEQRTFALTSLRSFGFGKKSYESKIQEEVDVFLKFLEEKKGQPFDINVHLHHCIANVICSIALGKHFEHDDPEFLHLLELFQTNLSNATYAVIADFFPITRYFPGDLFKQKLIIKNAARFYGLIQTYVDEHKKTYNENDMRDYIDCYIKELRSEKRDSTSFTEKQLLYSVSDLFVAGTETTSSSIKWAVLFILHNPNTQRKIQQELDSVVGQGRKPTLDDRSNLPYTQAFMHEVLRRADLATDVSHCNSKTDSKLCGYDIPAGTPILPNLHSVLFDPVLFPDPDRFQPERFLDGNGLLNIPEKLIPFGIGRRQCPGEILARSEFFLFLTCMLQRFSVKPLDKDRLPSLEGIKGGIVHGPKPYTFRAEKR